MNEKNTNEYLEKLKGIKLSDSSRTRMKETLLTYARFHTVEDAVRVGEDSRSIGEASGDASFISQLFTLRLQHMAIALLIALMIGGGTTYAAEGALPGDFLYPVKVEFNENVESAFAFTNSSEAKLQADLAKERLMEAEQLATKGELSAEVSSDIRARLSEHYTEATDLSNKAEIEGDVETAAAVRASLLTTLRASVGVLTNLDATVDGNESTSLVNDVRTYADATADAQATATAKINTDFKIKAGGLLDASVDVNSDGENDTSTDERTSSTSDTRNDVQIDADATIDTGVIDASTSVGAKGSLGL